MAKYNSKKEKKQEFQTEEVFKNLNKSAKKSEQFLEKYAKQFAIGFGIIIAFAFGWIAYLKFVVDPNTKEAQEKFIKAQNLFQKDSLDAALGGAANMGSDGFADIYEAYANTGAGKLSSLYAGLVEYKKGNYQKAIEYFDGFSSDDDIANALKYGAIGDAKVQLKNNAEALENYDKAISTTDNSGTKVYFMKKAGILALEMKKYKESLDYFKEISEKYPDVDTSGEVDAYLERLTYLNGNS